MNKIIFFLVCIFSTALFGATEAGKVIAIKGRAVAQAQGKERTLKRGASVFSEDTIVVDSDSRAQLRMTDGSVLTLIPDTTYSIDSYNYERGGGGVFASSVVRGGFRMISGSIGKQNPSEYTVKTPSATMGLRGTIFSVKVIGIRAFFSCESGSIEVINKFGSLLLGPSYPGQFGYVSSPDSSPQILNQRPTVLSLTQFAPPPGSGGCS